MAKKKKTPSPKVEEQEEKKDTLLQQVLNLVEHFISYFELLFLYLQKTVQKKIQTGFILTIAIVYLLFLKIAGSILIIIALYFTLLKFLDGSHIATAFILGVGITILSFIFLAVLVKKLV